MEQYEHMKNSGVPWMLDIPESWGIRVLFQLADQVKNRNKDLLEHNLLSLSYGKIKRKDINSSDGLLPESFDGYNIIEADDIVLRLTDLQNDHTSLRVGQSPERGIITSAYITLRPSSLIQPKYLYYVLHAYDLIKGFYGMGSGVRQGLNYDEVKTIKVPFPSLVEQQFIAGYLDDQVSQIDTVITEARESVEEYKQWRSAVILEAVTRGINTGVETCKSNIEWMGNIPCSWKTIRFSKANWIRARLGWKGLKAEEYVDAGYPFLSAFNIVDNQLCWTPLNFITQERYDESPEIKLSCGDVLLVKDGAGIGKCARIDSLPCGEATVNSSLAVITPVESVDYRYEYYYLQSPLFSNIINRLRNGMGVPHLTQEAMKEIRMPLPPKTEQVEIADYLDNQIADIDTLIAEKEALIADLESYKRSLIYETVTGKRKVV